MGSVLRRRVEREAAAIPCPGGVAQETARRESRVKRMRRGSRIAIRVKT
jgi:hypothetical protein